MRVRVSVIITNRNYKDYVNWSVASVLAQSYQASVIVVDEASTDGSLAVYDQYKNTPYVEFLLKGTAEGPAAARNAGIQHAWEKTDVFAFLDADDYFKREDAVSHFVQRFQISPKVGLVYADCELADYTTGKRIRIFREPFSFEALKERDIIGGNFAVSKTALAKAGKFRPEMKVAENYELARRVTKEFVAVHVPEDLIFVRKTNMALLTNVGDAEWDYYWRIADA